MIEQLTGDIYSFFLIFCRIGACFMVMPGFSSARVSPQIRILAALTISAAIAGFMPEGRTDGLGNNATLLVAIGQELLIGGYFGLVARIFLLALEFAMAGVAMTVGFGGMLGAPIEGTDAQSALTTFVSFCTLSVLFMTNFHHMVLEALLSTYDVDIFANDSGIRMMLVGLTDVLDETFSIAIRVASPFLAFAIIANLTVGFINKLAMQIPIYFIALPFILGGGLAILYICIPYVIGLYVGEFDMILNTVAQ